MVRLGKKVKGSAKLKQSGEEAELAARLEREQLMEPEETVTGHGPEEKGLWEYEERREGEKAWSSREVWRKEKRREEKRRTG